MRSANQPQSTVLQFFFKNFFVFILQGAVEEFGGLKSKARKEIFAPNDSETKVPYVFAIHLLALSPAEKKNLASTLLLSASVL